nr:phage tail tape measure protein [Lacticaseibacillus absianus]
MTIGITAPIIAGLGYAGKAAIDFDSQIQSMGSLLDDGTVSASALKAELAGLGNASKKWSVQYGVATSNINDGMSELIKKGYSYNQVLGAMPSILDAARASGDDFNSVMSVSTSTLEQFGLKSNNTAQMLKNTQRVTDSLTFVANKTSAGFSDMGNAMEYVGPVAHGLNMSLEQTASMIGLMSNQGIEGQKAGTALRGALSALLTPSKQNMQGFKALGVSVSEFKKGALSVPQMLDNIKKKSEGMTKQQLQSNLALAFGTEAQTGMNILVSEGGDALRKLTGETEKSTGYTKKLAETMNNTSKANVDKFKASLNTLAITFGSKLLPEITKLVEKGTDLVEWFTDLDEGTQEMILKSLLAAAAIGPVISGVGKLSTGLGALSHAGGGVITFIGRLTGKSAQTRTEAQLLESILGQLTGSAAPATAALETAAGAATKTGAGLVAATEGSTGFLASLAPFAPALAVVGVAVAGGIAWWELYGKKVAEAADRTSRWGSDIGEVADRSATKMQQASGKIRGAFDDTNHTVKENAKTIVDGFDAMTSAAKQAATESDKAAKKLAKSLGGAAGEAGEKAAAKEKVANDRRIAQMRENAQKAEEITRQSNKTGVELTVDQIQVLDNLRKDSAAQAVKTLHLSGTQENNVLKAIQGEKINISHEAAQKQYENMQVALQKEYQANTKAQNDIKNNAKLGTTVKNAMLEGLEKDHQTKLDAIYQGAIQSMKARGDSETEVLEGLQTAFDLTATEAKDAMDQYDDTMNKGVKSTKQFAAAVSENMSKNVQKAGRDWNSLVLDSKTGKVKTNLPELLKQTASTKEGWNKLNFDLKYAKISSNAKQTIAEALAASDQWKEMPSWEKNAIIRTQGREELSDLMSKFVDWNTLSLKGQQAIVKGDYTPLVNALVASGQWNELTLDQQMLLVKDKATPEIINALRLSGLWAKVKFDTKEALVNAKGQKEIQDILFSSGLWSQMDFPTQEATVKTKGNKDLMEVLYNFGTWQEMTPKEQQAVVQAKGKTELVDMILKYGRWNDMPEKTKKLLANDKDVRQKLVDAGIIIDDYNLNHNPKTKVARADTTNAQNNFGLGTASVEKYKKTDPGKTKVGKGDTKSTTTAFGKAKESIDKYRYTDPGSAKIARARDEASKAAKKAKGAVDEFASGKSVITKTLSVVTNFGKGVAKALGFRNGTSNFPGGPAIINDETGPVYKELLTFPNGNMAMVHARDVMLPDLPAGTSITPARKTADLIKSGAVPHFASGTTGGFNDAFDAITSLTPESASTFRPSAEPLRLQLDSGSATTIKGLDKSLAALQTMVQTLANGADDDGRVIEVHVHANLDKRELTNEIAEPIRIKLDKISRQKNRVKGVR